MGVYLGLGGYRLDGYDAAGERDDHSALGLAFGITGDYRLWRNLFLSAEITGHYVFLDRTNLFGPRSRTRPRWWDRPAHRGGSSRPRWRCDEASFGPNQRASAIADRSRMRRSARSQSVAPSYFSITLPLTSR